MSNAQQRSLVCRSIQGTELPLQADFDLQLGEILKEIRASASVSQWSQDNRWRDFPPHRSWHRLVAELLYHLQHHDNNRTSHEAATLQILDELASNHEPLMCWLCVRNLVLDHVVALSGWAESGLAQSAAYFQVERRGEEYFTKRDGEEVQVLGARTIDETRWDFIRDDIVRPYGLIRAILRVVAIRNVCIHFRANPYAYPVTMKLRLGEDQHSTWFLSWYWTTPWPFKRRSIPWRPDCNHGDPDYLSSDLIARFSEKEQIPERDNLAEELSEDLEQFRKMTSGFACQWEVALDTPLNLGRGPEAWFVFRGQPMRWINRTSHMMTTLVVPAKKLDYAGREYRLLFEFISALVFEHSQPIRISVMGGSGGCRPLPILRQPPSFGGLVIPEPQPLREDYVSGSREALAIALYAEGFSAGSVYYSFLNYYKVVELAHSGRKDNAFKWINDNLDQLRLSTQRLIEIRKTQKDVAEYLYVSNRCAVAHAASTPIADPDDPTDRSRVAGDLPIMEALARKAIEDGLLERTAVTAAP